MSKEKILNFLSFVLGLAGILVVVLFRNYLLIAGIFGSFISVLYGICHILNKDTYGYIFFSIGLSLFLGLLFYQNNIFTKGDTFTFIICGSIGILMAISLLFMYFNKKEIEKEYCLILEGEVIDLRHNPNTKRDFYKIIYQYTVDDKIYQVERPGYVERFVPKIGDRCKLHIDENDYGNVYFDKGKMEIIYDIGLSLFLMITSFIIILFLFLR